MGQPGSRGCWSERHAFAMRGSSSPRPLVSPPVPGAMRGLFPRIANAMPDHRQRHALQCAGFASDRVALQLARHCGAFPGLPIALTREPYGTACRAGRHPRRPASPPSLCAPCRPQDRASVRHQPNVTENPLDHRRGQRRYRAVIPFSRIRAKARIDSQGDLAAACRSSRRRARPLKMGWIGFRPTHLQSE